MSKNFFTSLLLLFLIRLLFDLAYAYCVVPEFGYEGYKLAVDAGQYIVSWILYLVVFPITPLRLRKMSDIVFMLVTTSIIAPITSMYGLSGRSVMPVVMSIASMALVYVIANLRFAKNLRLPYLHMGERLAVLISSAIVLIVVLHYLVSGVHLSFSLAKVYDFRSENAEMAGGGVFTYLNSWACQVFSLFLIAVSLMRGRYGAVAALFAIQIFLFAASQHKSVLFSPLVIVGVWWYLRRSDNLLLIPVSLVVLVGVPLLAYLMYHNVMLPSLAIRRIFFTPANLDFAYSSFFSVHPKVVWGDSFWMPFVHSPYPVTIPYVIGNYLGSPDMGANNGYVSSGFAQAGFVGVFIYSMILGYALRFVDYESRRLGATWFGVGLFLLPFMTIWRSSDLATSMLTHGFLVMLVLLGFLRRPDRGSVVLNKSDVEITRSPAGERKLLQRANGDQ